MLGRLFEASLNVLIVRRLRPVAHGLFSRGAAELAEYWMKVGNDNLEDFLEKDTLKGEELVSAAIFVRLQHNIPHLRSWPQAMAYGLLPDNVSNTLQKLHELVDLICTKADKSEESTHWAERHTLVGTIYAASELYMLTDYSEGYIDTKNFIDSRLKGKSSICCHT